MQNVADLSADARNNFEIGIVPMKNATAKAAPEKQARSTPAQKPNPEMAMTGAEIIIRALIDQGVDTIFGYPGGAVLPIYDALFKQNSITHVLVRHEQGAAHAAEGYARSTGKVGVLLVTSGPRRDERRNRHAPMP